MTGEPLDTLVEELNRVLGGRRQDPAAAAAVLERAVAAVRSDPAATERWHEPELLDDLVDCYEQLGRTDDAIAAMRAAITAGWDGRPDGRCRIAELLMRAGRVAEAGPLWAQVTADTPRDIWLYNNAGLEYADVGDHETALTWLTDGLNLALTTGDPERLIDQLRDLRGTVLTRLGRLPDQLQERARAFLDDPAPTRRGFVPATATRPDDHHPAVRPRPEPSPFQRPLAPASGSAPPPAGMPHDEPKACEPGTRTLLALAWFPAEEYPAALYRWPELTTEGAAKGATDHAAYNHALERTLQKYANAGLTRLAIAPIRIPDFLTWCTDHGNDPATPAARATYSADLARRGGAIAWPPTRNRPCWCGSGRKYKQCCRPADAR